MSEHPYTPTEAAEWLCRGGPCVESGDRCKVLAENCCLCVYSGNLIVRQSAEIKTNDRRYRMAQDRANNDIERQKHINTTHLEEHKRLVAENERLKGVLAELESALGLDAPVSTEQKRSQDGNKVTQDLSVCPGCGGPADNGFSRSVPPDPYYCTKCDPDEKGQTQND